MKKFKNISAKKKKVFKIFLRIENCGDTIKKWSELI